LPAWIEKQINTNWPDHAAGIFAALNERAPLTLRVNATVTDRDQLIGRFEESGLGVEKCEYALNGVRVPDAPPVTSLPGFADGEFSVQDQSAQLAASLLQPKANERVLDACAAPGGKSCHLLELEPSIKLICLDDDPRRMERVEQNLQRLKLHATTVCGDAANSESWWDKKQFDAILLDAPCSALGALRRHPDIRLLRRESDISTLSGRQIELLRSLWPLLKPGGRLIYATCSVLKQENEQCVDNFSGAASGRRFLLCKAAKS